MVGVQWDLLIVFVEWSQFARKLWAMCGNPLPGSFMCFFQAETKFYFAGYNMETNKRQLWKTCILLLSRGSSPLRAPLLGLWNVLRLKTTSLWAPAVLSPCSCKSRQSRPCLHFCVGSLKVELGCQAWQWGKIATVPAVSVGFTSVAPNNWASVYSKKL